MLSLAPVFSALKEYAMSQRKSPLDKYLGALGTGTVQWSVCALAGENRCNL